MKHIHVNGTFIFGKVPMFCGNESFNVTKFTNIFGTGFVVTRDNVHCLTVHWPSPPPKDPRVTRFTF